MIMKFSHGIWLRLTETNAVISILGCIFHIKSCAYELSARCVQGAYEVRLHVQIIGRMAADTKLPTIISLLMVVAYASYIYIRAS